MIVAFRGRGAAQQKDRRDCSKRKDHHQFEIVDIADNSGLHLYHLVERGTSACCPRAPGMQNNAVIEGTISCCDVTRDRRMIDLFVSGQQIRHDRYTDTGPDIAGEIVQTGRFDAFWNAVAG